MARVVAGREKETIEELQMFYRGYNPGYSLDYKFLDEDFQKQYASEKRVAVLSQYFAGLAILISCLGLFALAAFTAERRIKEIGVRKVLGASEMGIVYLLSGDFTKIVLIAIVIALPVSYFMASYWLSSFAFKIELTWWYFGAAGISALLITWLTVGIQAIKAARVNPVTSLRSE
jgi:ABC-type antimicrobial peptide transport system permease subunit